MKYQFLKEYENPLFNFIIHRVNLPDQQAVCKNPFLKSLVGSKSGISIIDSKNKTILIPPGAGVEVDFWIFGDEKIIITHNNPELNKINEYPCLEEYIEAWQIKRAAEQESHIQHGIILANLKTHGNEELFINKLEKLGIPNNEIVLLDEEPPATDRLLRKEANKVTYHCLARRVSRIESLANVLLSLNQDEFLESPSALFYDPNGCWQLNSYWPFDKKTVEKIYAKAPRILTILCCPSRWGHSEQIEPLAHRLIESGLKLNYVMTDIEFMKKWQPFVTV